MTAAAVSYSNRISDWVAHTLEVRNRAIDLLEEVEALEPSWLGNLYLISKPLQPLDPKARLQAFHDLQDLRSLVIDNPAQGRRVEQMRSLVEAELEQLDESVKQARPVGDGFVVDTSAAQKIMGSFRALVAEFNEVEDTLIVKREQAARRARSISLALIVACLIGLAATIVAVLAMSNAYVRNLNRETRLRHEAEMKAARSQRMEAVGQLAGGVAHDFNNLLTVIVMSLGLLKRRLASLGNLDKNSLENSIDMAMRAASGGAALTKRLLAYSRQQVLMPKNVNINAIIGDLSDMLSRTVGEQIRIDTQLENDLWNCFVDPSQLESAILNLVINARDAMPNGGRLTVKTENAALGESYRDDFEDVTPGEYVAVSISDTGVGMTEEVTKRAFEPFFSTKEPTKGSGLGLAMVDGFVKQSHGHVRIDGEAGRGTTVKMYFQRSSKSAFIPSPAEPAASDKLSARPGEVVLMVEDDEAVRESSRATLEELGFQVVVAASAAEALETFRRGDRVDLLFTDIVLPGGADGVELAEKVCSIRPNLPVLFTTGYARRDRLGREAQLLTKPYSQNDLAVAICHSIDRGRAIIGHQPA